MKGFDDGLYRVWQRLVVYGGCALDKMVQLLLVASTTRSGHDRLTRGELMRGLDTEIH